MPTQSLILRGEVNRRLTIAEMDGNFTYLESLAQSESSSQPNNQIPVGTGTGLTSSESFTYDYINDNFKSSLDNTISSTSSCQSAIVGGRYNNIVENEGVVILGGTGNRICCASDFSIISGGYVNRICCHSEQSAIIGGRSNCISCCSLNTSIVGGHNNSIITTGLTFSDYYGNVFNICFSIILIK